MDNRTGDMITSEQADRGEYIWLVKNPLYFKVISHRQRPFGDPYDIITIQIRFNHNLRKSLCIHKCWINFEIWTRLTPTSSAFIGRIRFNVMKYLDNVGVISINHVIRAVSTALAELDPYINDVIQTSDVKFNVY